MGGSNSSSASDTARLSDSYNKSQNVVRNLQNTGNVQIGTDALKALSEDSTGGMDLEAYKPLLMVGGVAIAALVVMKMMGGK